MKIFMTSNVFSISRTMSYGGERIIFYLIEALAHRGHDVYAFTREGSNFDGVPIKAYIPVEPMNDKYDVHFKAACEYSDRTGINPDVYFCGYFGKGDPQMFERWPYAELIWCRWSHAGFEFQVPPFNIVSYSNLLHQDMLDSGIKTTMIHYGLPQDLYAFQPDKEDYVVWLGKAESGKAPWIAGELAKTTGTKLVYMCPPYNTGTMWDQVLPYVDNRQIFWVRGVDDKMKYEIMSKAKCLLYTNDSSWREHAGIIMLEAMAMGTPIIGMSMVQKPCSVETDKFVKDGVNGFVLHYKSDNLAEILNEGIPLLQRIHEIDSAECRKQFDERFTADLMAKRYEWMFERVAKGERFGDARVPF